MERPVLNIILGPTASGKEAAGYALAKRLGAEIIVVDSMKIYCGLDIGTAKPTTAMRAAVKHHCLDLLEPTENFSVAEYVRAADKAIAAIHAAGKPIVLVGGTALYYKGLLEGLCPAPEADLALRAELTAWAEVHGLPALYARLQTADPAAAAKIHANDARRIVRALEVAQLTGQKLSEQQTQWPGFHRNAADDAGNTPAAAPGSGFRYTARIFFLDRPRAELRARIGERVEKMLAAGLLAEAEQVYRRRHEIARAPLQAVGYKEFFPYFSGEMPLPEAVALLKTRTCQLAKSQMTWFRKFPAIRLEPAAAQPAEELAEQILSLINSEPAAE